MQLDAAENQTITHKNTGFPIKCNICNTPLERPGAILFGPPVAIMHDLKPPYNDETYARKHHICTECYADICKEFNLTP